MGSGWFAQVVLGGLLWGHAVPEEGPPLSSGFKFFYNIPEKKLSPLCEVSRIRVLGKFKAMLRSRDLFELWASIS